VTDSNGCTSTDDVSVSFSNNLNIDAGADITICENSGSVVLSAAGAATYTWSPAGLLDNANSSSPIATVSETTTFTVVGNDGTCSDSETITVFVENTPVMVNAGDDLDLCTGSTQVLNPNVFATNGTYEWSPTLGLSDPYSLTPTLSAVESALYTLIVTDENGCSESDDILVTVASDEDMYAIPVESICEGNSVTMNAFGGNTYFWFPNIGLDDNTIASPTVSVVSDATYFVIIDNGICEKIDTVNVQMNSVTVDVSEDQLLCGGNSTQLSASGGISYLWTPLSMFDNPTVANPTVTVDSTTTFFVEINTGDCIFTEQVTVTLSDEETSFSVLTSEASICGGESATLTTDSENAISYSWSPSVGLSCTDCPSPSASPTVTTTYSCLINFVNGCTSSSEITIGVTNQLEVSVEPAIRVICEGDEVYLEASGADNYTWAPSDFLNSSTGSQVIAAPTEDIVYTVTGTNSNNTCSGTATATISIDDLEQIIVSNDTSICEPAWISLSIDGGLVYNWMGDGITNSILEEQRVYISETSVYSIQVITQANCFITKEITVTVDNCQIEFDPEFIPNAITPNGDGINDVWEIEGLKYFTGNTVAIFNRWGEKLFGTTNYDNSWDGTYNGKLLASGTYYYVILTDEAEEPITGTITVLYD